MAMYTKDATDLLTYVGGKENISAVTHCVTRMRFVLIDDKKADVKRLKLFQVQKEPLHNPDNFRSLLEMTCRNSTMNLSRYQA